MISKDSKKSSNKRPASASVLGQHTRSCRCGQQLDVCARAHCPRCGRTLGRD